MKPLSLLIFLISILLCSCNNNEPALEVELPINSVFVPVTIQINKSELSEQEQAEIMDLVNNRHIVNDVSELPNDPIGHNEAFLDVDYSAQTLLIMYLFKIWTFDTYSSRFYRNTRENSFNWVVRLGITGDYDEVAETVQLTRFAILVRKLPVDADVQTWYSMTQIGS